MQGARSASHRLILGLSSRMLIRSSANNERGVPSCPNFEPRAHYARHIGSLTGDARLEFFRKLSGLAPEMLV